MGLRRIYCFIVGTENTAEAMTRNQFTDFVEHLTDISEVERDPAEIDALWKLFNKKNGEKITFE